MNKMWLQPFSICCLIYIYKYISTINVSYKCTVINTFCQFLWFFPWKQFYLGNTCKEAPKKDPSIPQTPNSTTKFKMLKNYKMQQDCSYMRQNLPVESMWDISVTCITNTLSLSCFMLLRYPVQKGQNKNFPTIYYKWIVDHMCQI